MPKPSLSAVVTVPPESAHSAWDWPSPSHVGYALSPDWLRAECEIKGLTSATVSARLLAFEPGQQSLRVRVNATGAAMDLRFDQFRRLTLTVPCRAVQPTTDDDPHAALLNPYLATDFKVRLVSGGKLNGRTVGHVETEFGLFLFPPVDDRGSVQRMFVPRGAFESFEVGLRIGEVLVAQNAVTAEQVESAAAQQVQLRARKLGELLLAERIVEPDQLLVAIDQQAKMPVVRIGEALVALKLITDTQLTQALTHQNEDRTVPLGELLVRNGHVSRVDLQLALARKMGYPVVDVSSFPVEAEAVRSLPFSVARRMEVLPLLLRGSQLVVAMADPSRRGDMDELEFISQFKVVPALAPGDDLPTAIVLNYQRFGVDAGAGYGSESEPREASNDFESGDASKLVESLELQHHQRESEEEIAIEQSDNSLVRLIHTAIIEAHNQRVSDIHVETLPGREKVRIRFRKDGVLRPYLELPHTYRAAIVARIKIMCGLDISGRRKPQDGKINFAKFSPQHRLELRVATIPTNNGLEDVVLRLLSSARAIPLEKLQLSDDNYKRLRMAVERPYGLVLCVGPTGSGKTTTLHSALATINTPQRKIWTAENPVEITQAGLRQVQMNPKIDWTFAKALRSFLRADPDVIMVGEIRDTETAQMAIEASLTGHLVMTTLHTNSAPETVTRLLDMGMDPFNFADSLLAVLAQRLVRCLCPSCRVAREATSEEVDELLHDWLHAFDADRAPKADEVLAGWRARYGVDGKLMSYASPGCALCEQSGVRGRAALHELMHTTRELRRLVQTGARAAEIQQQAMADGMRTLRQDGIEKVLTGVTSIAEVRSTSNV